MNMYVVLYKYKLQHQIKYIFLRNLLNVRIIQNLSLNYLMSENQKS